MKLKEIAALVKGSIINVCDSLDINSVSSIENSKTGDMTFLTSAKYVEKLNASKASAVIIPKNFECKNIKIPCICVDNPYFAVIELVKTFYPKKNDFNGISSLSHVDKTVKLGSNVTIYPFVYIGSDVTVGDNVTIHSFCFIGHGCNIGSDTRIYPNVSIIEKVNIGKRCIVHAGTVLGADGYGFVKKGLEHIKIPHVGGVDIGDDVELGANVCVDRAMLDKTRVGAGTKTDNLVHIAHNCEVGRNVLFIGQSGIGGSTKIGDNTIVGPQVGVLDHIDIGDNVIIGAKAGVTSDIESKQIYLGIPAIKAGDYKRVIAAEHRLPELFKRVKQMEKQIEQLQHALDVSLSKEDSSK